MLFHVPAETGSGEPAHIIASVKSSLFLFARPISHCVGLKSVVIFWYSGIFRISSQSFSKANLSYLRKERQAHFRLKPFG